MRENNEIQLHIFDRREIRHGVIDEFFWVQTCVYQNVKATDLDIGRVGADATEAIQVDKFHG